MKKEFQTARNGYNKDEVEIYIENLEDKIDEKQQEITVLTDELKSLKKQYSSIKEKEENISIALTAAVEKAKQIEASSLNVYKLKIEELKILYARWERVLNELVDKYPSLDEVDNVKRLMAEFKSAIKSSIKEDFRFSNSTSVNAISSDPMRALLDRMNSGMDRQMEQGKEVRVVKKQRRQVPNDMQNKQSELSRLEEKSTMIKPIFEASIKNAENGESLLDKFLGEDAEPDSVYASKLTSKVAVMPDVNESGFDLKEAVNPKEDLEQIMKSFDFFKQNNN